MEKEIKFNSAVAQEYYEELKKDKQIKAIYMRNNTIYVAYKSGGADKYTRDSFYREAKFEMERKKKEEQKNERDTK